METPALLKDEPEGRIFAEFHRSGTFGNPVTVYRYRADGGTERVGTIYTNYDEQDGPIYTCFDLNNKMLFAASDDYGLAEAQFEKFCKDILIREIGGQNRGKGFHERVNELRNLRNRNEHEKDRRIES